MNKEPGAGEKLLLFSRNISIIFGATALAAAALLPGTQVAFGNFAAGLFVTGAVIEAGRQILTNSTRRKLGKAALA